MRASSTRSWIWGTKIRKGKRKETDREIKRKESGKDGNEREKRKDHWPALFPTFEFDNAAAEKKRTVQYEILHSRRRVAEGDVRDHRNWQTSNGLTVAVSII